MPFSQVHPQPDPSQRYNWIDDEILARLQTLRLPVAKTATDEQLLRRLTLDLTRMQLVPGALVTVRGQSRFGDTVNADSGLLLPVNTYSAHWLARPEFFSAVDRFIRAESRHVDRYVDAVAAHSPYKDEAKP